MAKDDNKIMDKRYRDALRRASKIDFDMLSGEDKEDVIRELLIQVGFLENTLQMRMMALGSTMITLAIGIHLCFSCFTWQVGIVATVLSLALWGYMLREYMVRLRAIEKLYRVYDRLAR